jgi:hypothetical protein
LRSGDTASHSAVADGNWHSFNASHGANESGARSNDESSTTLASNLHSTASVGHADLAAGNHALSGVGSHSLSGSVTSRNLAVRNSVFANGPLRGDLLFNGGFNRGFYGRGPLIGGFGCCGFGWGLGFGWGWGWGWGFGWSPFWDWYPYWGYSPWWGYPYAYPY